MQTQKTPLSRCIALALVASASVIPQVQAQTTSNSPRAPLNAPVHSEHSESAMEIRDGRAAVFIEFSGAAAATVFTAERTRFQDANRVSFGGDQEALNEAAERSAARAAFASAAALREAQQPLITALTEALGSHVLYNARFALNGVAAMVPIEKLDAVRNLPGVARISPLVSHQLHAASSIDFTGARTFWGSAAPDLNLRGAGIGVGVIDSGIDHMHTNFGGPGGSSYASNITAATAFPAPPTAPVAANFPTPKVVWGYDYVGDAYNAGAATDPPRFPIPDPNPMDTGGHGTSVSSLIAGFGTNNDGSTYAGVFNRTAPNIFSGQRTSSGYAPSAALYAFRVFGTSGSTQVTASALDSATAIYLWQADTSIPWDGAVTGTVFNLAGQATVVNYTIPQPPVAPRLRVVNLSLGSNAGDIEDSSAIATQRAADAGLIVVLSAGNADDTYFITGSPGVASGGISVAASFNNQFPGGTAMAPANAASNPAQPALGNAPINNVGTASFTAAAINFGPTDSIYAIPPYGGRTATAPVGYLPPGNDQGNLVTLQDPAGLDINLFSFSAGNLVVAFNPAANNIYAGKVLLIDRGGGIGFHQKALAVQRAGGIAALVVNNAPGAAGMAANANLPTLSIPSAMIEQSVGASFTLDGSLNLVTPIRPNPSTRAGLQLSFSPFNSALQDNMAAYSSRGPRRNDDAIKPDISAPAENVTVATATTGAGVGGFNGTSSAAPHTAGAMALLRGLNPNWSNYELKAALLNNTHRNVFNSAGANPSSPPSGQIWGLTRQGAGRWDLSRFSGGGSKVIMFGADPQPTDAVSRAGMVSVSFGAFDVTASSTLERNVTIRNKGNTAQAFNIGFVNVTDTPGVSISLPDGDTVSIPGFGERIVRVRLTATAEQMRHARDVSLRPFQFITSTAPANRVARQFMNEESGYLTLTPTAGGEPSHRLSVQAFPRRASNLALGAASVVGGTTQAPSFTGQGFNTGSNTAFVDTATFANQPPLVDMVSFAKGFELSYESPAPTANLTPAQRAGDVQFVGITSDFARRALPFDPATSNNASTVLMFAVAARGQFDTVQSGVGAEYQIDIDTSGDNVADRMVRQFAFSNGERTTVTTNISLPVMSSVAPFTAGTGTGWFLNAISNVYTNLYNNSVVMIPVSVSGSATGSMALTAANSRFNYRVRGLHRGLQISQTPWLSYDVARPGIVFQNTDEPSLVTPVNASGALQNLPFTSFVSNLRDSAARGLLMIYPTNAEGARAQSIGITIPEKLFSDGLEPANR